MRKVKVAEVDAGLHPSEIVVVIKTSVGEQNQVIDRRSLQNGFLMIGFPIRQHEQNYLIELPRETSSGSWQVWVAKSEIEAETERQFS